MALKQVIQMTRLQTSWNALAFKSVGVREKFYQAVKKEINEQYISVLRSPECAKNEECFEMGCAILIECLSSDACRECLGFWTTLLPDGRRALTPLFVEVVSLALQKLPVIHSSTQLSPKSEWVVATLLVACLRFLGRLGLRRFQDDVLCGMILITAKCTELIEKATASANVVRVSSAAASQVQFTFDGLRRAGRESVDWSVPWQAIPRFLACIVHAVAGGLTNDHAGHGSQSKASRAFTMLLGRLLTTVPALAGVFPANSKGNPSSLVLAHTIATTMRRSMGTSVDASVTPWMPLNICLELLSPAWMHAWKNMKDEHLRPHVLTEGNVPVAFAISSALTSEHVYEEVGHLLSAAALEVTSGCQHMSHKPSMFNGTLANRLSEGIWSFLLWDGKQSVQRTATATSCSNHSKGSAFPHVWPLAGRLLALLSRIYSLNCNAVPSYHRDKDIQRVFVLLSDLVDNLKKPHSTSMLAATSAGRYLGTLLDAICDSCIEVTVGRRTFTQQRAGAGLTEANVQAIESLVTEHIAESPTLQQLRYQSAAASPEKSRQLSKFLLQAFAWATALCTCRTPRLTRNLWKRFMHQLQVDWPMVAKDLTSLVALIPINEAASRESPATIPLPVRLDTEPSMKRARASNELRRQTAARVTKMHTAVALKASCSLLLIILQGRQPFESESPSWALAAASQILGSSGQCAAGFENHEDFCSKTSVGGQLPLIFHGLVQTLVANVTHHSPGFSDNGVQSHVHELLHQRLPFGALWLVLFAVRVLNPANRVDDMHTPVKQAARILMKLAAPDMWHPAEALDKTDKQVSYALLFVAFLPTVCNAASQALRHRSRPGAERDRSSRQLGNGSGVYNACASDLGLEIAAYLYGAWVDHRTRIKQHMAGKENADWGVHLCNLVLAQLCFGVSSLFQQLFAYDPAGTQYQNGLEGIAQKHRQSSSKLWDKINNFPTSTATSLQGWLPIFTPIMAELRQFSGVAPSANPGVQTLAQCYYFSLVLPHLPVQEEETYPTDSQGGKGTGGVMSLAAYVSSLFQALLVVGADDVQLLTTPAHHNDVFDRCFEAVMQHPVFCKDDGGSSSDAEPSFYLPQPFVGSSSVTAPLSFNGIVDGLRKVHSEAARLWKTQESERLSVFSAAPVPQRRFSAIRCNVIRALGTLASCAAKQISRRMYQPNASEGLEKSAMVWKLEGDVELCLLELLSIWTRVDFELSRRSLSTADEQCDSLANLRMEQILAGEMIKRTATARGTTVEFLFGLFPHRLYGRFFKLLKLQYDHDQQVQPKTFKGGPGSPYAESTLAARTLRNFLAEVLQGSVSEQHFVTRATGYALASVVRQCNETVLKQFANFHHALTDGGNPPPNKHRQLLAVEEYRVRVCAEIMLQEDDVSVHSFFRRLVGGSTEDSLDTFKSSIRFLTWELGHPVQQRIADAKVALLVLDEAMQVASNSEPNVSSDKTAAVKQFVETNFFFMMHNLSLGRRAWLTEYMAVHQPFMDTYMHALRCIRSIISIIGAKPLVASPDNSGCSQVKRTRHAALPTSSSEGSSGTPCQADDDNLTSVLKYLPKLVSVLKDARITLVQSTASDFDDTIRSNTRPKYSELPQAHWTLLKAWQTLLSVLDGGIANKRDSVQQLANVGVSAADIAVLSEANICTLGNLVDEKRLSSAIGISEENAIRLQNAARHLVGTVWDEWAVDVLVELLEFWPIPLLSHKLNETGQSCARCSPGELQVNWAPVRQLVTSLVNDILVNKMRPEIVCGNLSSLTLLNLPDLPEDHRFDTARAAIVQLRGEHGAQPRILDFLERVRSKLQSRNGSLQRSALTTLLVWLKKNQRVLLALTGPNAQEILRSPCTSFARGVHNGGTSDGSENVGIGAETDFGTASLDPQLYCTPADGHVPQILDDIVYSVIDVNCIRDVEARTGGETSNDSQSPFARNIDIRRQTRLLCAQVLGYIGAIDPALLRDAHRLGAVGERDGSRNSNSVDALVQARIHAFGKRDSVNDLAMELLRRFLTKSLMAAEKQQDQNCFAFSIQETLKVVAKHHELNPEVDVFPTHLFQDFPTAMVEVIAAYWNSRFFREGDRKSKETTADTKDNVKATGPTPTDDNTQEPSANISRASRSYSRRRKTVLASILTDDYMRRFSASYLFNCWLGRWLMALAMRTNPRGRLHTLMQACDMAVKSFSAPDLCLFLLPKVVMQLCYPNGEDTGDPHTLGDPDDISAVSKEMNSVFQTAITVNSVAERKRGSRSVFSRHGGDVHAAKKRAIVNLCRQAVLQVLDAVQKELSVLMVAWPSIQAIMRRKAGARSRHTGHVKEPQLQHALLTVIEHKLLLKTAMQSQDYARALQYFEYRAFLQYNAAAHNTSGNNGEITLPAPAADAARDLCPDPEQEANFSKADLQLLQEVFLRLRDTDGLSGIASKTRALNASDYGSAKFLRASGSQNSGTLQHPSDSRSEDVSSAGEVIEGLLHRVIQHEDEGNWTHAINCYERALSFLSANDKSYETGSGQHLTAHVKRDDELEQQRTSLLLSRATKFHHGVLRCMKAMGHYTSIISYVRGVVTSSDRTTQSLAADLLPQAVDAAWRTGQWDNLAEMLQWTQENNTQKTLERAVEQTTDEISPSKRVDTQILLGKALLLLHRGDVPGFQQVVASARLQTASQIDIAGSSSYGRVYPAMLTLHFLADLEAFQESAGNISRAVAERCSGKIAPKMEQLQQRLLRTQLSPYARDGVGALHRSLFSQVCGSTDLSSFDHGRAMAESWLHIANVHFVAGSLDSALSAAENAKDACETYFKAIGRVSGLAVATSDHSLLRVRVMHSRVQILCGRIYRQQGQLSHAVQEMEKFDDFFTDGLGGNDETGAVIASTHEDALLTVQCLGYLLRTEWMQESACLEPEATLRRYNRAIQARPSWEFSYFSLGRYYDKMLVQIRASFDASRTQNSGRSDKSGAVLQSRSHGRTGSAADSELTIVLKIIQNYGEALRFGHTNIFQSLPRLLTLWFETASSIPSTSTLARELYKRMHILALDLPAYQWLTALPQLISRISHGNSGVLKVLMAVLVKILKAFPSQSLWAFIGASETMNRRREERIKAVLAKAEAVSRLKDQIRTTQELIRTLNDIAKDTHGVTSKKRYSVRRLRELPVDANKVLLPLQCTLTPNLPTLSAGTQVSDESGTSSRGRRHGRQLESNQVFPGETRIYVQKFDEWADVMASKEKPKRVKILGCNGKKYYFLVKAEKTGDLRKDMRMMELCTVINRLLHEDVAGQQRSLSLRTFAVTPLSDRCGIIEWVNNTSGIRMLIRQSYISVGLKSPIAIISTRRDEYERLQKHSPTLEKKVDAYRSKILALFPRLMHRWFMRSTANPTEWFNKRRTFARSCGAWSIVGYFLGLGDRHGENIMCDATTGECVHVDFDCLFDKGLALAVPEVVPFRLTPNMVNAFGVNGYDGDFRKVCETMVRIMRSNRGLLMNVLEAFLHDPLVEWRAKKKSSDTSSSSTSKTGAKQRARGIGTGTGLAARRAALTSVPLSQKRMPGGVTGYEGLSGLGRDGDDNDEERDGVNENAKRIIHRIGQRLRGLYQRKMDLLVHDEEFAVAFERVRTRVKSFGNIFTSATRNGSSRAGGHSGDPKGDGLIEGSTASFLANRLPLSIEGQVNQLLEEATDDRNLCHMYVGWMPFL